MERENFQGENVSQQRPIRQPSRPVSNGRPIPVQNGRPMAPRRPLPPQGARPINSQPRPVAPNPHVQPVEQKTQVSQHVVIKPENSEKVNNNVVEYENNETVANTNEVTVSEMQNDVPENAVREVKHNSSFDVNAFSYFMHCFGMFLLNIITLGAAGLGNEIRNMKFLAAHAVIDGYNIKFNGRKRQLRRKYSGWNIKTFLTLGFYKYFKDINFEKWKVKHTKFVDKSQREGSSSFEGKTSEWLNIYFKCWALKWLTLGIGLPLADFYKCQYFVNNTYVNGHKLQYDRTKQDVLQQMKKDILFSFLTIGLYGVIVVPYKSLKADLSHIYLADNCLDGAVVVEESEKYTLEKIHKEKVSKILRSCISSFVVAGILLLLSYVVLPLFSDSSNSNGIMFDIKNITGAIGFFVLIFVLIYAILISIAYSIVYAVSKKKRDPNVKDKAVPTANYSKDEVKTQYEAIKEKVKAKQLLDENESIIFYYKKIGLANKLLIVLVILLIYGGQFIMNIPALMSFIK